MKHTRALAEQALSWPKARQRPRDQWRDHNCCEDSHRPNETELSDRRRGRAPLWLEMLYSSEMWGVQRVAVRSSDWLDLFVSLECFSDAFQKSLNLWHLVDLVLKILPLQFCYRRFKLSPE